MKFIYAHYLAYRDGDGELSTDRYIRVIMEDGHDLMVLAKPFFALREFLDNGGKIIPPEPVVPMQVNLDLARGVKPMAIGTAPPVEDKDV